MNNMEYKLEMDSSFLKCGGCGSVNSSTSMKFCPNPLKNRDGEAYICWDCCKKCSWSMMVNDFGGLQCNFLNCLKGVFWLIEGKLVCYKTMLNKDDFSVEDAWFELFGKTADKFDVYPYGRVKIDNNKPIIVLYHKLFSDAEIENIVKEYSLDITVYKIAKKY